MPLIRASRFAYDNNGNLIESGNAAKEAGVGREMARG